MKRLFLLIAALFCIITLQAQNGLNLSLSDNYTQYNVVLSYSRQFHKHEISIGVKYLLQPIRMSKSFFYHKYFAENVKEGLGLDVNYAYSFYTIGKLSTNAFYNFQYTNATLRLDETTIIGKSSSIENNLGLGLAFDITKHFAFQSQAGIGLIKVFPPENVYGGTWDYCYMLRFGIKYRF